MGVAVLVLIGWNDDYTGFQVHPFPFEARQVSTAQSGVDPQVDYWRQVGRQLSEEPG